MWCGGDCVTARGPFTAAEESGGQEVTCAVCGTLQSDGRIIGSAPFNTIGPVRCSCAPARSPVLNL